MRNATPSPAKKSPPRPRSGTRLPNEDDAQRDQRQRQKRARHRRPTVVGLIRSAHGLCLGRIAARQSCTRFATLAPPISNPFRVEDSSVRRTSGGSGGFAEQAFYGIDEVAEVERFGEDRGRFEVGSPCFHFVGSRQDDDGNQS